MYLILQLYWKFPLDLKWYYNSTFIMVVQPEIVHRVEKDIMSIMAGGTAHNVDILPES